MSIISNIASLRQQIPDGVTLVCVSKFHPVTALAEAYEAGERHFGESRVQELVLKAPQLPDDIHWHFIGHLQTNKVKQIVPFVYLIQSVDSLNLLEKINLEASKINRVINVLIEVHVAQEETKTGFSLNEAEDLLCQHDLQYRFPFVRIQGIMGMATNTDDFSQVRNEFARLHQLSASHPEFPVLSMGMSDDFAEAIAEGSNMVRIGSSIFGPREY